MMQFNQEIEKQRSDCDLKIQELQEIIKQKSFTIKELEEEKNYQLLLFNNLKKEIEELRNEKNMKIESFNELLRKLEKRIIFLENENNDLKQSSERKELEYHSQAHDELMEKLKNFEFKIQEEAKTKETLENHWLEVYEVLEEKVKEIEIFKENFVKVF